MPDDPSGWSRPRVAAGVLFFDEQERILLVKPTYKDGWDVPGGYVNSGETPYEAARREVCEELGFDAELGRALAVDWAPHPAEGDKMLLLFDGGELDADAQSRIVLSRDELSEYAFRDLATCESVLIERLARRVTAAVRARQTGRTAYLESGRQPQPQPQPGRFPS